MSTLVVLAVVVGVAVVVGLLIALALWRNARRDREMRAFAADKSLSYMGDTWVLGDCDFSLFRKGTRRRWSNVISGVWNGTTLVYADYEFKDASGPSAETLQISTVVTDLGSSMPEVEVTARSVAGELAEELGVHGVDFDSEEFNKRFVVEAEDEKFALDLIDARMMDVLLSCPPDVHVQFGPNRMVVWGQRRTPATIAPLLDAAASLDQRVPVMVRRGEAVRA